MAPETIPASVSATAPRANDPPDVAQARDRAMRPRPARRVPTRDVEHRGDEGSLVTEYGLIAILGATIVGLAMKWASAGAIWELFGAVIDRALAAVG